MLISAAAVERDGHPAAARGPEHDGPLPLRGLGRGAALPDRIQREGPRSRR